MANGNVEVRNEAVRRLLAAFEDEDDAFRAALHPEIEWYPIEENRTPTRGINAALWNRNQWLDTWDEHQLDVEEVIEDGDDVVACVHIVARGKGSGVEADVRFFAQFKVRDGKVAYIYDHDERAAALEAAGLSEQTMSRENVEIVREAWDAYSRGDYDRVGGFHDPHIVVVTLEDGVVSGNDAVLANYKRWNEAWESAETTLEEVIGHGDRVFLTVRFHGRGRASGVEVETLLYEVYMLRDGKVLRIDEYEERAEALEAAGLSE